jgi:hypothetical protein
VCINGDEVVNNITFPSTVGIYNCMIHSALLVVLGEEKRFKMPNMEQTHLVKAMWDCLDVHYFLKGFIVLGEELGADFIGNGEDVTEAPKDDLFLAMWI